MVRACIPFISYVAYFLRPIVTMRTQMNDMQLHNIFLHHNLDLQYCIKCILDTIFVGGEQEKVKLFVL